MTDDLNDELDDDDNGAVHEPPLHGNLSEDFIFSQGSLQDYADCARRFQLRYLQRLIYPAAEVEPLLEFEQRSQQGAAFHHMVHQHLVGIPAEVLSKRAQTEPLAGWWRNYLRHGLDLPANRKPETTLIAPIGDFALVAKYDLLAIEAGQRAVIVDWKTTRTRPVRERFAKQLQTIVYRYLLVQSGAHLNGGKPIVPEQVEMIYWFAEFPNEPERFPYDAVQFAEDEAYLLGLIDEINTRTEFPLTDNLQRCWFCVYRSLNDRGEEAGDISELDADAETDINTALDTGFDFDQIAEIEF